MNFQGIEGKKLIIYGFGIAGKWLSDNLSVNYFVDTDNKKYGKYHGGKVVKERGALLNEKLDELLVIVTVVDINDVVQYLDANGVPWISLGDIMRGNSIDGTTNNTGESNEFLKYSVETAVRCQEAFLSDDQLFIRSVDLVITEKCTLKCKDCANLMQYYKDPKTYSQDNIIKGFSELVEKCDYINEVRVIGGEPFLNKDIYTIIESVANESKVGNVVIYTNGMVPPKLERMKELKELRSKVLFSITDYGELGRNLDKTVQVLNDSGVAYRVHPPEHWTDSGRILEEKLSEDESQSNFENCCGKNLYTLIGSKLYRCPFAANSEQFNGIPYAVNNSVGVTTSASDIKRYLYGEQALDACSFCPGRSFNAPLIEPAIQVKSPLPYKVYLINKS